jgi:hypothetical protein
LEKLDLRDREKEKRERKKMRDNERARWKKEGGPSFSSRDLGN